MKIVLAPDSFKGCLTAAEVCRALEAGIRRLLPGAEIVSVPMADGGEGTVQSMVAATGGRLLSAEVEGPLGQPVQAAFGILADGQTAVLEMAAASGLTLLPPTQRNPLLTSTFGTGQLIRAALDQGARRLIIGIGGSATTDAGAAAAQAVGAVMRDAQGCVIPRVTGGRLAEVAHIDASGLDPRLAATQVRVACDVDNPLYGERGAAHVYGPQKGATPQMVAELDAGLRSFARRLRDDLGADLADLPGAGAAGGLGAGLVAFCGATLERGVRIVSEAVGLRDKLRGADLCLTGEGRLDRQTAFGKTPSGVAQVAGELGVPVIAVGGAVDPTAAAALYQAGFCALHSILNEPLALEQAMEPRRAEALLALAGEEIVRLVMIRA